jgi:hypothetical protein
LVCRRGWWYDWRINFHFTSVQHIVLIVLLNNLRCRYVNTMHKFQYNNNLILSSSEQPWKYMFTNTYSWYPY